MSEAISEKIVTVAENMERVFAAGARSVGGIGEVNTLQEALDAIIEIQENYIEPYENAEEVAF